MSVEELGAIESGSFGDLFTSGAVDTKGAYEQLIASSSALAIGIYLIIDYGTANSMLVDIATGGAGAETDVIANILLGGGNDGNTRAPNTYSFPINIAASSRVAIRSQSSGATQAARAKGWLLGQSTNKWQDMTRATTYGANTADSGGVAVNTGAVANTKGVYSEITASTTNVIDWVVVQFSCGDNTVPADATFMVDIATGAAASESVVIPNIWVRTGAISHAKPISVGPLPVSISSGTRLAARAQSNITDATDRIIDVSVIGLDGITAGGSGGAAFNAYIK